MTATKTINATNGAGSRLRALGADCGAASCPACGRVLLDGARCACPSSEPRRARPRLSLTETLDAGWATVVPDRLARLACRGEVLA